MKQTNLFNLSQDELAIFSRLNSPSKIQDFVNAIPTNFEKDGPTCLSPRMILQQKRAQCIEGALFAAAALRMHNYPPLIVGLKSSLQDFDHVIAVFQINGHWGAISKTNHNYLRYRDPVYQTVRELIMSYFNEYLVEMGSKTLRQYSNPFNLSHFDEHGWMTAEDHVWYIPKFLRNLQHYSILPSDEEGLLRPPDTIEILAMQIEEWPENN